MATNPPPPPSYDAEQPGIAAPLGSQPPLAGFNVPPPAGYSNQPPQYPAGSYPQQPYAQQPAPAYSGSPSQQQNTVVLMQGPAFTPAHQKFGEHSVQTTCTVCNTAISTRTKYETGSLTWIVFAVLCFFGCWLCSCIPFCVSSCKDVVHSCPNCNAVLGKYRRLK